MSLHPDYMLRASEYSASSWSIFLQISVGERSIQKEEWLVQQASSKMIRDIGCSGSFVFQHQEMLDRSSLFSYLTDLLRKPVQARKNLITNHLSRGHPDTALQWTPALGDHREEDAGWPSFLSAEVWALSSCSAAERTLPFWVIIVNLKNDVGWGWSTRQESA